MTETQSPFPPSYEPAAPPPPRNNTLKWVLGCSLGCLVIIILVVAAVVVGGYFVVTTAKNQGISATYDALKQQNKVPAEHAAAYDQLAQLGQREGSSLAAVTLVITLMQGTLNDGVVSEPEATAVQDAIQLLQKNPSISFEDVGKFTQQHPDVNARFEAGTPNTSDTGEVTAPEETAPANAAPEEPAPAAPDATAPGATEAPATTP